MTRIGLLLGLLLVLSSCCDVKDQAVKDGVRLTTCRLESYTKTGLTPAGGAFTSEEIVLRVKTYAELRALVEAGDCTGVKP